MLVVSKFHCFYLAQKSRRRVADLLDLSRHVEIDLSCLRPGPRLFFLLKTCRRFGFKQVLSKIDVMEFGHYEAVQCFVWSKTGTLNFVTVKYEGRSISSRTVLLVKHRANTEYRN